MRSLKEIWKDWQSLVLNPWDDVEISNTVARVRVNLPRYKEVADMFNMPAWVIGAIHYRESDFDFTTWLANGDPLMRHGKPAVTVHVPKGLGPAFSWENAAELSLVQEKWHSGMSWDLVSALQHLEAYNGWGYYRHGVVSPYIWSGTNHYGTGKYSSDGHYDPGLRDKQLGCAAIALGLKHSGLDLHETKPE